MNIAYLLVSCLFLISIETKRLIKRKEYENWRMEAIILAVGMLLLGVFIKNGFSEFAQKDRSVNVKGLAEMEVPADKVTWPLVYKSLGE